MENLKYIIFLVFILEISSYIFKYWNFIPLEKNYKLFKLFFYKGFPLFKSRIISKNSKEKILDFTRHNVKPVKIYNDTIYIRRKYLKWIWWATPIPLQSKIVIEEINDTCYLNVKMETLYIPFFAIISPIIINSFTKEISTLYAILMSVFLAFFSFLFALIERNAIISKITKISNLDRSYNFFS